MNQDTTIRGYRILGERKPERELSYDYLRMSHEATLAQDALRESAAKNGANCVGREEFFSGPELPNDRDAKLACAGCPSRVECELFRRLGRPAYGVWAGEVIGRGTMEDLEKEES